jgi:GDP-D-mannose dehydratase
VVLNPTLFRPLEISFSSGDPAKAERDLGWRTNKKMRDVVSKLVEAEYVRRAQVPA